MEDEFTELCRDRVPDTADWIFTEPDFAEWDGNVTNGLPLLLIYRPPGSGKSVLAPHIVRHLSKRASPGRFCLYSFCRHDDKEHDLKSILRTIVYTLAHQVGE